MATPLVTRSVNDLQYGYMLSSAYRTAWVYEPAFYQAKEADFYEVVLRDTNTCSSIYRHINNVVRPWRVEPPPGSKREEDKTVAAITQHAFQKIRGYNGFDASRRDLAQADFLGRTYAFIESAKVNVDLGETGAMDWIVPTGLKYIDRRRFHWVPDQQANPQSGGSVNTSLELYSLTRNRWEPVLHPEYFIKYTFFDTEDRLGYGRGMLEAIYFAHYMKTTTWEKIQQGVDRWANGILVGKLDSLRNASTGKTNTDLLSSMKAVLQDMRTQHIVVLQDGDEIEVKETSGTGHEVGMSVVSYWDDAIERLCNGSVRPVGLGGQKTGARAQSQTEEDTSEAFYQPFRQTLDSVLSRDLVGWFWKVNRLNFIKLGLSEAEMPFFVSEQIKKEDPLVAMQVASQMQMMGAPVILSQLYHKSGFDQPDADDEVLEGRLQPMPGELGDTAGGLKPDPTKEKPPKPKGE